MSWGHYRFPGGVHSWEQGGELALPAPAGASAEAASGPKPRLLLASFLDAVADPASPSPGPLAVAARQRPAAGLQSWLAAQSPEYRGRLAERLGASALEELTSLSLESDPELFFRHALALGGRWAREDRLEAATLLFQSLAGAEGEFPAAFAGLRARAETEWRALSGQGAAGPRLEFLLRRFAREASDPWMIAGFGVGSLAYKTVRLGVLSRLASPAGAGLIPHRIAAGLLASGAGLSAEVPAFVLVSKLGRELSGARQDWSASALGHELAATGITLFCLKGAGALSHGAVRAMSARASASPLARELGAFTRLAQTALPQAGMFAGIVAARRAEEALGLRPRLDGATLFVDSLSTFLQFHVGGRLAERVLGAGFAARQRELDLRAALVASGPTGFLGGAFGPLPVAAAPAVGRRASLAELLHAPLLSENRNGDGGPGGKNGKNGSASHLRPVAPGETPPSEAEARKSAELHDPKAFAEEVRAQLREERHALASAVSALRSMSEMAQTFMIHAAQGRRGAPEMAAFQREILATYDRFLQKYLDASRRHQASIPIAPGYPALQAEVIKSRADTQRFLDQASGVHAEAQKVLEAVAEGGAPALHDALRGLHRKIPDLTGRAPVWVTEGSALLREEIFFAKLSGILQGVIVKEAYRGTTEEAKLVREFQLHPWNLLSRGSERLQDGQILESLFAELRQFRERDWDPADTLILRAYPSREEQPDTVAREVAPREVLRWGGAYGEPFRTWIGAQLPALMAAYRGDANLFLERIRGLELFMEPDTREATRAAAWWLGKAVHASGYPSEWAIESGAPALGARARRAALGPAADLARAERELGRSGDSAAVGHALHAFLRHSFEPRAALELALQSPEPVREDAVSLAGALLGAFHGRGAFPPEWMAGVILNAVPGRVEREALRQVTEFINQELQLENALSDLRSFSEGKGEWGKVTPLRAFRASAASPAWRAFRAGYDERFQNGELSAVQAIWESSVLLEQGRHEGLSPEEWRDLRRNLRASIHRVEATLGALRELRARGASALKDQPEGFLEFDRKTVKLIETEAALRSFYAIWNEPGAPRGPERIEQARYERLRDALLKAIEVWDAPALVGLRQGVAEPLPLEGVRALQAGAGFIGRSVRPPVYSPLFEKRGDPETVDATLRAFAAFAPMAPPSAENLMESYLMAVGAGYLRHPGHSLADQISPSAMFSVLAPAYLEANRRHPARALRELSTLRSAEGSELREAWRVATYAALRLLQGAKPDLAFAQELRRTFVDSTMAQGLSSVIELKLGGEAARNERLRLLEWEASPDMRHRVLLGLHAFLQAPQDARSAVKALGFSATDPHQVAERVAGMLAEARRAVAKDEDPPASGPRQLMLDKARPEMLDLNRMDESPDRLKEDVLAVMAEPSAGKWREALERQMLAQVPAERQGDLRRALDALHPELLAVFGLAVDKIPAASLLQALWEMKLLPAAFAALGETKAPQPLTDQDRESLVAVLREDYRMLFGKEMPAASKELASDLETHSESALGLLGHWSHHPGSRLLMARRLGVRGLPDEKAILAAYQKWNDTPPSSE